MSDGYKFKIQQTKVSLYMYIEMKESKLQLHLKETIVFNIQFQQQTFSSFSAFYNINVQQNYYNFSLQFFFSSHFLLFQHHQCNINNIIYKTFNVFRDRGKMRSKEMKKNKDFLWLKQQEMKKIK